MTQQNLMKISASKIRLNKIKTFFMQPHNVILIIMGVLCTMTTVFPMVAILEDTIKVHPGTIETWWADKANGYTLASYKELFFGELAVKNLWSPLLNTLVVASLSCLAAIIFGGLFAFLITRTNLKFKKYLSSIFIFPYIMPQWTLAMVWKNVFNSAAVTGGSDGLLASLFNIRMPLWWCQGIFPCVIVLGLHYSAFAYILIGGILRNMDANLEEAATVLKAGRMKIIRRITLPIVMPALVSTFLLVFSSSMSAYAVPKYLSNNKFDVLTTYMKSFIKQSMYGQAYIMGLVMIILGVSILLVNQYVTGKRKSFTTVSGKSGQISFIDLKWGKWVAAVIFCFLSLFFAVMPLITFALESLCVHPGNYSELTLEFWISKTPTGSENGIRGLFFEPQVWSAFGNSLLLSLLCAVIAGTSGILIGYAVAKRRGTLLSRGVDAMAFMPYLLPSMALGGAFLTMATTFGLQKTFIILVMVGAIKYLPFASRSGINAMLQLSGEIEEAAVMMNVPWWKRMVRIIFPIQKSTFMSGYLLPFTSCMRELSLFVLLVAPSTQLLATLLDEWTNWWTQSANALNLLIIVTVLVINFVANKVTGASIDKGVGG